MANVVIEIKAITAGAIAAIRSLSASVASLGSGMKSSVTSSGAFQKSIGGLSNAANGMANRVRGAAASIGNFNTVARVGVSSARAIGTSMIFAGGAFRDLGVGINVAASTLQAFIPIVGAFVDAIGPAALILVPIAGALAAMGAELAVAGVALYEVAQQGIEFNQVMETTQISIATLVTQFKNIYDVTGKQVGALREVTDAQIKSMSATERDTYSKQLAISVNEKLTASMGIAQRAFLTLTVEAVQSPFTTLELANAFKATESVMGKYNITLDETAKLTVLLSRVAAVAGISGGQLATQFTLFLTGAGRITSPLTRFANQIGLTKDKMKELSAELLAARSSPEKTAAIMSVLTTRLAAFDEAGQRIAASWQGIMSNMLEAFQLFSGTVTKGLFENIRNAFYNIVPVTDAAGKQLVNIFDKNGDLIATKWEGTFKKIEGQTYSSVTKVQGFLTDIFNYDDSGLLKKVGTLADVFKENLQPGVVVIADLFTQIGVDLASLLTKSGGLLNTIFTYIGDHRDDIFNIYNDVKNILTAVFEIFKSILPIFGVSKDIHTNVSNLHTVLVYVQILLVSIADTIDIIHYSFDKLLVAANNLISALVKVGELVVAIASGNYAEAVGIIWGSKDDAAGFAERARQEGVYADQVASSMRERHNAINQSIIDQKNEKAAYDQKLATTIKSIKAEKELTVVSHGRRGDTGLVSSHAGRIYTPQEEAAIKLQAEKQIAFGTPPPLLTTKPRINPGDTGAGKGSSQTERLKSLFAERKAFADAELAAEKSHESDMFNAVKSALERQADILKSQLDDQKLNYSQYYGGLDKLRQQETAAELQHQKNLGIILQQQYIYTQDAQKNEEKDINDNYDRSKKRDIDKAKRDRDLQALAIKSDTERIKLKQEEASITANIAEIGAKDQEKKRQQVIEQIKSTHELFGKLSDIQGELNNLTGSTSPEALAQGEDAINRAIAPRYKALQAQLGINKDLDVEINKQLDSLAQIRDIEVERLQNSQLQIIVEEASTAHAEEQARLEELASAGLISHVQYQKQQVALSRQYADTLEATIKKLEVAANEAARAGDRPEFDKLTKQIEDAEVEIFKFRTVTESVLIDAGKSFQDNFVTFFTDIQKNIRGVRGAFENLATSILGTIQKLLAEKLVRDFLGFLFPSEDNTKGTAGGVFAGILRRIGLDPNSAAAKNNPKGVDRTASGETIIKDVGEKPLDASKNIIQATIAKLDGETAQLNVVLDSLNTTLTTLNGTLSKLAAVPAADKHVQVEDKGAGPTVISGGSGGSTGITDSSGATVSLDSIGTGSVFMPLLDEEGGEITLVPIDVAASAAKAAFPATQLKIASGFDVVFKTLLKNAGTWISKLFSGIGNFFGSFFGGGGHTEVLGATITGIAKASGGHISGPGGPTEDKIPAWLSNGEYVVKAAAVKALGIPYLNMINSADSGGMHGFAGGGPYGGLLSSISKLPKSVNLGRTPLHVGGIKGFLGGQIGGSLISAGITIGLALLSRLFAKKQPKSDPNRTKDPYGLNPDTLTFYKKPIISGSRNYLAKGGFVTSSRGLVGNISRFANGGFSGVDSINGFLSQLDNQASGGDSTTINNHVNINTPDIHSFRNSRAAIERDLSRVTSRGVKRKTQKY
jgi:hypothetical protein